MRRDVLIGVAVVSVALIAAGAYVAFARGTPMKEAPPGDTARNATAPTSCDPPKVLHPREGRCVDATEGCRAYLDGTDDREVSCRIASDGRAFLDISLQGDGEARIRVLDGSGATVFDRREAFSSASALDVAGAAGTWELRVDFDAQGSANVVLWG